MGWISTLVVLNDHLHEIGKDPTFGRRVETAVLKLYEEKPQDIGHYGMAIESHHNDGIIPVLVGHGGGRPLSVSVPWHAADPELELLKRLAEKHGYTLRRRPSRT
jgi:hypothetical protein